MYTAGWNVWGDWVLAVYHHKHKNWVPSILTHNLWLIFIRMKLKEIQNCRLKKGHFSKSQILNTFLWNFYGLVLRLVELIDAKIHLFCNTFLEKCTKVVLKKWFCKLGFFFWSTTLLEPEKMLIYGIKPSFFLVNPFSRTRKKNPSLQKHFSPTWKKCGFIV